MIVNDTVITCCHDGCGISFSVPSWWETNRRDDHKTWYCPNGHGQSFRGESEADKARRELQRVQQRLAEKDDEIRRQRDVIQVTERQVSAQKGIVTKLKKRASAGTCPCCQRSFQNMARHMKTEHPEFAKPELKVVA